MSFQQSQAWVAFLPSDLKFLFELLQLPYERKTYQTYGRNFQNTLMTVRSFQRNIHTVWGIRSSFTVSFQISYYLKRVRMRSFSGPNPGKHGPEKGRIRTLFTQCKSASMCLTFSHQKLRHLYFLAFLS